MQSLKNLYHLEDSGSVSHFTNSFLDVFYVIGTLISNKRLTTNVTGKTSNTNNQYLNSYNINTGKGVKITHYNGRKKEIKACCI